MITNTQSGTRVDEIAAGIFRINTPISIPGAGQFSFNQYLIADDAPLLFHTGPSRLFPLVHEALASVIPAQRLRYVAFSHFEADECGSLNQFLRVAPEAVPVCGGIAAMTSISDIAERAPVVLADGQELELGKRTVRWFDTPHVPHAWECGLLLEVTTKTLLCGDLFTQGGSGEIALTTSDIVGPSEEFRRPLDYYAHAPQTQAVLERLALEKPTTLGCMHGSAWSGKGEQPLRELAAALSRGQH
jgi:flavorubredoxin